LDEVINRLIPLAVYILETSTAVTDFLAQYYIVCFFESFVAYGSGPFIPGAFYGTFPAIYTIVLATGTREKNNQD